MLSALQSVGFDDEEDGGGGGGEDGGGFEDLFSDHEWPEFTHGMPLGNIVERIRIGDLNVKNEEEKKVSSVWVRDDEGVGQSGRIRTRLLTPKPNPTRFRPSLMSSALTGATRRSARRPRSRGH